MEYITQKDINRFNLLWDKIGDCHIWKNQLDKDGYGIFYFYKKSRKAHRFSYYLVNGDIPDGMVIDHLCRNRNCVNQKHLRCITKSQNSLENSLSIGAINKMKKFCKNGHNLDRVYGIKKRQRYCSTCSNEKSKRLRKKWSVEAKHVKC